MPKVEYEGMILGETPDQQFRKLKSLEKEFLDMVNKAEKLLLEIEKRLSKVV